MAKFREIKAKLTESVGTKNMSAVLATVKDIPLGDIRMKENVRKEYTNIEELAASIREHGLLQPITVYPDADDYIVKTGHRRFQAYSLLFKDEPERFHSIRCVVSNADNIAVIQLVENVQRENLSQLDLFNALSALREQGMTLKQIADVMGKSEGYVKNLFVGVNEIAKNEQLKEVLDSHGAVTIQDVIETKSISDKELRLELLDQRKKGEISQKDLRKKAKELKECVSANDSTKASGIIQETKPKSCELSLNQDALQITLVFDDIEAFHLIGKDVEGFLAGHGIRCDK